MSPGSYFLLCAAFMIPDPEKADTGGEDAYFISREYNVIGVADGIGGWIDVPGSNSSFWSRSIMERSHQFAAARSPFEIITLATNDFTSQVQGSTTVSIVSLQGSSVEAYIIGDSGMAVFRKGRLLVQANLSTVGFNFPRQIGSHGFGDVTEGATTVIGVEAGDVVVLGTDGLWDNIFEQEIGDVLLQLQTSIEESEEFVAAAAETLAAKASKYGADGLYDSPFAVRAREDGQEFQGGKLDDVAVIVAQVAHRNNRGGL
jgi:protein phosphatase PTC7